MTRPLPQTILVAVDGSKPALEAARYATAFAKRLGAQLCVVHVIEMVSATVGAPAGTGAWTTVLQTMKESARGIVGLAVREAETMQVPFTVAVVEAMDAAAGIVSQADRVQADLIVVGSHGRRGISRFVLGSVAEKVARSANCPVLVAR